MTTPIDVDASAGVEIVTSTERGRRLAQLVPAAAELWVPEHFYSEVFASIRYLHVVAGKLTVQRAEAAIERLTRWHLRQVGLVSLIRPAWAYRHNKSGADGLYVALAEYLGASLLTDDLRLANAPTFPTTVAVLRLSVR